MTFREYRRLVSSDLFRITRDDRFSSVLRRALFSDTFQYVFLLRTCAYLHSHKALRWTLYPLFRFCHVRSRYKYGIFIPFHTKIGPGFFIGHCGGIVVNEHSVIGKNCNLSHGVTLGQANRGRNKGYPVIGNHVYIGPGAKIIGAVTIGDHAAVGANCVVTKDVPPCAVVVGIPAKIISDKGSEGYVENTDYEDRLPLL